MSQLTFEVEQIIDRKVFSGKVLYLTKWKGFSESQATWQSVKVLKEYKYLIKRFNRKKKYKQESTEEEKQEDFKKNYQTSALNFEEHNLDKIRQKQFSSIIEIGKSKEADNDEKDIGEKEREQSENLHKKSQLMTVTERIISNLKEQLDLKHKQLIEKDKKCVQSVQSKLVLKRIRCGFRAQGRIEYIVQDQQGQAHKMPSQQLSQDYPKLLISYLETCLYRQGGSIF